MSRYHYLLRLAAIGMRFFLGLIFLTAGMGKLVPGFRGLIGPVWLEAELEPYGLGLFARFVAFSQVGVGLLLVTQRFATLGAIMLFPMLLSIFMVTVSLDWPGTPYVNAFFLLLNLYLLAYDYPKLKFLLTEDVQPLAQQPVVRKSPGADALWLAGVLLVLTAAAIGKTHTALSYNIFWAAVILFCVLQARPLIRSWVRRYVTKPQLAPVPEEKREAL